MKTRVKIIIDKLLGTPVVYVMNVIARVLGFFLKIDHSLDKPFKSIVVSKYVGLGSIIQASPLLQTLRLNYPKAKISFITTSGGRGLLKHIPEVDEILTVSDQNIIKVFSSSLQLLMQLWKIKPQVFIDLEFYSNYSSIITTLSKARNRLGFYKEGERYRKGVYNYLLPFNVNVPISSTYLQFAQLLKCKPEVTDLKIMVNKADHWDHISKKINISQAEKYIVINPNASDLRIERRWPMTSFVELIRFFEKQTTGYKIILIGDTNDAPYVDELETQVGKSKRIINSSGKLNLSELIVVIAKAQLMVTNDTGPMHIAFATGTKTISLFGPCSPQQYGGLKNVITFYKQVHCSPCVHKYILPPCHGDNQCMKQIGVEEVQVALIKAVTL